MDVVGDAPPRLVLAEVVGEVDVDGSSHICDVARRSALFKRRRATMVRAMRALFLLCSGCRPAPAARRPGPSRASAGRSAAGVGTRRRLHHGRAGRARVPQLVYRCAWRAAQVKTFNDYLVGAQVGGIVPTWQLFRTATSWKDCGAQPFEIPPTEEWPNIVQTLRYIRDYVIPALGPVEPVSVYRNPMLNVCAGGAPESAHKLYSAIDMVPLRPITRETMMRTLCVDHSSHGEAYHAGLGFYAYHAIPHRQHQVPPLEHGPGGCRGMPADRPSRGCRRRSASPSRRLQSRLRPSRRRRTRWRPRRRCRRSLSEASRTSFGCTHRPLCR